MKNKTRYLICNKKTLRAGRIWMLISIFILQRGFRPVAGCWSISWIQFFLSNLPQCTSFHTDGLHCTRPRGLDGAELRVDMYLSSWKSKKLSVWRWKTSRRQVAQVVWTTTTVCKLTVSVMHRQCRFADVKAAGLWSIDLICDLRHRSCCFPMLMTHQRPCAEYNVQS